MMYGFIKSNIIVGTALCTILICQTASAQIKTSESNEDLERTEQRLKDLINAAANQNLVDVKENLEGAIQAPDGKTIVGTCAASQHLTFSPNSFADSYEDILLLKSTMITGPDQIDAQKTHTLAMAYLGLGFTDEAVNIAEYLPTNASRTIKAAAYVLADQPLGHLIPTPQDLFAVELENCAGQAHIWAAMARRDYQPLSRTALAQIDGFPATLRDIILRKLGIISVQNGDILTARKLHKILQTHPQKPTLSNKPVFRNRSNYTPEANDELQLFEALLSTHDANLDNYNAGIEQLKSIAQRDGVSQGQALQALAGIASTQTSPASNTPPYQGYLQDLNSAAQTFSDHPEGQNVQAHKINYLANQRAYMAAINLTQKTFTPDHILFKDSVLVISENLIADLVGADRHKQLSALNIVTSTNGFFKNLADEFPLKKASITACVELELYSLVANILPAAQWHILNDDILQKLALQNYTAQYEIQFPKRIYQTPALKAAEIRRAFHNRQPAKAASLKARSRKVTDKLNTIDTMYTRSAWDYGYWSLAKSETGLNNQVPHISPKLAVTLSSLSPTLLSSHRPENLQDMQALQSHLNSDLEIFTTYLKPASSVQSEASNG